MQQVLERRAVEDRKEQLLSDLAITRQRVRDTRNKAAIDDGFDEELVGLLATEKRLESKLEGLSAAFEKVDEQEATKREAEAARIQREGLFETIKLMHMRIAAFEALDAALSGANEALGEASKVSSAYTSTASKHAGNLRGLHGVVFEGRLFDLFADFQAKFANGHLPVGFATEYRTRAESELAQMRAKFPEIVDDKFIADAVAAGVKVP